MDNEPVGVDVRQKIPWLPLGRRARHEKLTAMPIASWPPPHKPDARRMAPRMAPISATKHGSGELALAYGWHGGPKASANEASACSSITSPTKSKAAGCSQVPTGVFNRVRNAIGHERYKAFADVLVARLRFAELNRCWSDVRLYSGDDAEQKCGGMNCSPFGKPPIVVESQFPPPSQRNGIFSESPRVSDTIRAR